MGLSVGGLNTFNYALQNTSAVSSAYTQSMKNIQRTGAFADIDAANPVVYPNAQVVDPAKQVKASQETNKEFNSVASGFMGMTTGYGGAGTSTGYEMLGSNFDAFA